MSRPIEHFDTLVDNAFDHLRGRKAFDRLFYAASAVGDHSLLWHIIGWGRVLRSSQNLPAARRLTLVLAMESALINGGVKRFFGRSRPVTVQTRPHYLRTPRTSSFPSGHATSAFCAAALLNDLNDSNDDACRKGFYVLAAVVAASRIHVRIHHASDVVGGIIIGTLLGRVARRFPL